MMKVSGTALVTGSSRGIGRAVALELARRGFEVVASMRNPDDGESLLAAASDEQLALRVDRLDVPAAANLSMPEGLRVLVNNAGVEDEYLPVEHTSLDLWERMFRTNVFGLVEVTRRAIPTLRANGGGVICNVTSSSLLHPVPFYAAYRASKAAVSALGESLRSELAPFGIRLVEIMPGPIETDMLAGSDRPPEALRYPEYRALAEQSLEGRRSVEGKTTPSAIAAGLIADAILDDDAPLRSGCDPMSRDMLSGWRSMSDQEWLAALIGSGAPGDTV